MKKLAIIAMTIFAIGAKAQEKSSTTTAIQSGTWNTQANLNFFSSNQENNQAEVSNSNFGLNATLGYAVSKNLEIGLGAGYNTNTTENKLLTNTNEITRRDFTINAYIKQYVFIIPNLAFTAQGTISYGGGVMEYNNDTTQDDLTTYAIQLVPGLSYFATEHLAITAQIGNISYRHTKTEFQNIPEPVKRDDFGVHLNMSNITLGIAYYW
jgi:opacity protein-like surface antigen